MHIAAWLAMCIFIRAPEYEEDPERNKEAKRIYWVLIIFHIVMAFIKFHSTFLSKYFWDKMTTFILILCVLITYLCGNWVYNPPKHDIEPASEEQQRFESWLFIELILVIAYISGAATYIIIYHFQKPSLEFPVPALGL